MNHVYCIRLGLIAADTLNRSLIKETEDGRDNEAMKMTQKILLHGVSQEGRH